MTGDEIADLIRTESAKESRGDEEMQRRLNAAMVRCFKLGTSFVLAQMEAHKAMKEAQSK